jgi:hypothetical protein
MQKTPLRIDSSLENSKSSLNETNPIVIPESPPTNRVFADLSNSPLLNDSLIDDIRREIGDVDYQEVLTKLDIIPESPPKTSKAQESSIMIISPKSM